MTRNRTHGIRILLLSDNLLLAQSVECALNRQERVESVRYLHDDRDAISFLSVHPTDVVFVDLDGFVGHETAILRSLVATAADAKVIAFLKDEEWESAIQAIEDGAAACVFHSAGISELMDSIASAHSGHPVSDDRVIAGVLERVRELARDMESMDAFNVKGELTEREQEILRLLESGLLNKEITQDLRIALSTVKNHIHRIFKKLQVTTRRGAVRRAARLGLLVQDT